MRNLCLAASLTLSLLAPAWARPATPPSLVGKRISQDFVKADLVYVVKTLARMMGRNVYIGPGAEGEVTLSLRSVSPEAALAEVLKTQDHEIAYRFLGASSLVVASPEKVDQIGKDMFLCRPWRKPQGSDIRREILLERAPAAKVIGALQMQFKDLEFIPHPTRNGFYAVGSRKDILAAVVLIPELDVSQQEDSSETIQDFVQVKYGDLAELKSLIETLVPDVRFDFDESQSTLILEGTPLAVEQAKELLDQLDRPLDQVVLECKMVGLTAAGQSNLGLEWDPQAWSGEEIQGLRVVSGESTGEAGPVPLKFGRFARTNVVPFPMFRSDASTLASPRIALQGGVAGEIHIGDKFPLVYFDYRVGAFEIAYQDLGLKLTTTCTLRPDNRVTCDLQGEFTILRELLAQQYPARRTVKFHREMTLDDGQTLIIGGLATPEQLTQALEAVPLLADLPIQGNLFRSSGSGNEIYLMITPNIMR